MLFFKDTISKNNFLTPPHFFWRFERFEVARVVPFLDFYVDQEEPEVGLGQDTGSQTVAGN